MELGIRGRCLIIIEKDGGAVESYNSNPSPFLFQGRNFKGILNSNNFLVPRSILFNSLLYLQYKIDIQYQQ